MSDTLKLALAVGVLLAGMALLRPVGPRYQIAGSSGAWVARLDTKTGEIAMCRAQRMVFTCGGQAEGREGGVLD